MSQKIIHQFNLVHEILDFFSASREKQLEMRKELGLPKIGPIMSVSIYNFLEYKERKGIKISPFERESILALIRKMESKSYLTFTGSCGFFGGLEKSYECQKVLTDIQKKSNYWMTEILGFEFLIQKIEPIIVQIVGQKKNGDKHCGTGLLYTENTILTCAHVITDMELDEDQFVCKNNVKVIDYKTHNKIDIGYIQIDKKFPEYVEGIAFAEPQLLKEILITGYPKIPSTKNQTMMCQRGEINSFVEGFREDEYFLYSAITRPGSSGSPIFSDQGYVLGIASRDFYEQGKDVRFFAGVPRESIFSAMKDLNPNIELLCENFI